MCSVCFQPYFLLYIRVSSEHLLPHAPVGGSRVSSLIHILHLPSIFEKFTCL